MQKERESKKTFTNPIYKDKATVLVSNGDGGRYSLGELVVYPGGGNFFHTHSAFEETFTAIQGQLGVAMNKTKYHLSPGESMTIPRGTSHHFFNPGSEPVTCQIKFMPAHENFIKGIAIAYGLAEDGKTSAEGQPKNLMHIALLLDLTDTRPTEMPVFLYRIFRWIAKIARLSGMENKLLTKYYYQ